MSNTNNENWVVRDESGRIVVGPVSIEEAKKQLQTLTESSTQAKLSLAQILSE